MSKVRTAIMAASAIVSVGLTTTAIMWPRQYVVDRPSTCGIGSSCRLCGCKEGEWCRNELDALDKVRCSPEPWTPQGKGLGSRSP